VFKIGIYSKSAFSRSGMKQIVQDQDVAEFESLAEARKSAAIFRSLVLLVHESDLFSDDEDDRKLGDDRLKVVVVAPKFNMEKMLVLFNKGVRGYQLETVSPAAMRTTLQMVALGEFVMPSTLAQHLASTPKEVGALPLSAKELVVMRWLAKGYANKEISRYVGITEATTKVHIKAIMRKLNVANRTQAAVWAVRNGLDRPVLHLWNPEVRRPDSQTTQLQEAG
jgi:two-component system nitrate/nitrite response regulator NarL